MATDDGRYYSRGQSHRDDLKAVKDDVVVHRAGATDALNLIDANLRELPEALEILAHRQDTKSMKTLLEFAGPANDKQEDFKKELEDLDRQGERINSFKPRKAKQFVSHRDDLFKLGLKYMDLRERTNVIGGAFVETMFGVLDRPKTSGEARSE